MEDVDFNEIPIKNNKLHNWDGLVCHGYFCNGYFKFVESISKHHSYNIL